MQAATSAPFGPANVPLVLVRAMQAVKSIGRVGSGSSVLAKAGASGRDSAGTPLITALRESCGYLRDADYHQTAQLMTVAADEIERLNRELRVSPKPLTPEKNQTGRIMRCRRSREGAFAAPCATALTPSR